MVKLLEQLLVLHIGRSFIKSNQLEFKQRKKANNSKQIVVYMLIMHYLIKELSGDLIKI
jgi:hypothetical protein